MQQINNRHKFILPGYYFRKKFYAQTGLILFLSEFHPTIHCFLGIFCGDTSGSDSIDIGDLRAGKRELFDSYAEIGVCFS